MTQKKQHSPTRPPVLIGGENLIDFVETPQEGLDNAPQYTALPGGSPFNVAIAAARQGLNVQYLTPISTDRLGSLLAERLEQSGVVLRSPRSKAPSSLAIVSLYQGQPSYQFYRDNTAERLIAQETLDQILKEDVWAYHIGSLALSGGEDARLWHNFFNTCHQRGVITSLDPNVRPALIDQRDAYIQRLEDMFQYADIIKLSDEDIAWLYPKDDIMTAFDQLIAQSCDGIRVLTKGASGAVAVAKKSRRVTSTTIEAAPVEMLADTVGAGDTFTASILAWLGRQGKITRDDISTLAEQDLTAMAEWAAKAAALNCQRHGCNPPHLSELTHG